MVDPIHTTADPRERLRTVLRQRAESFVGTVAFLHGTAELCDPLTAAPRALDSGMRVAAGMRLKVLSGRMLLRMDDGSDVWLAAGAEVDLSPWMGIARELKLLAGRMLALVAPDRTRPFRTLATTGQIEVTGTAFEANATAHALEVGVLHGSVRVRNEHGEVRLRRGRTALSTIRHAPESSAYVPDATHFQWLADLSPSASNPSVRSAFSATSRMTGQTGGNPAGNHTMTGRKNPMKKLLVAAVVLAVLGAGAAFALRGNKDTAKDAPQFTLSPNGGAALPHDARVTVKLADGTEMEINPADPKSVQEFMQKLPPEQRGRIRFEATKDGNHTFEFETADGKAEQKQLRLSLGEGREAIDRNAHSAADMMKALIESGMSPEEASRIVSASLSDSITKQLRAENPDASVQVQVFTSENMSEGLKLAKPDGSTGKPPEGAMMLMIASDKPAEQPKKGS